MTTLASLKTQVRDRADMAQSQFITDTELTAYINAEYKELYDILTNSFEDYYTLPPVQQVISSGDSLPLPADFYKLRGVDYTTDGGSTWFQLTKFDFNRRNRRAITLPEFEKQYRIVGANLYITPYDNATGTYRLWYIPKAANLVDDADEMNDVNGWDEYVVVGAAIKCKQKQEDDTQDLKQDKQMLRARILEASKNRDAGTPERITDVYYDYYEYPGRGWRFDP